MERRRQQPEQQQVGIQLPDHGAPQHQPEEQQVLGQAGAVGRRTETPWPSRTLAQEGVPTTGATVYSADGEHLGTVKAVSGSCLQVDAPLRPDYWLAPDCVASSTATEVRLSVTKDRLRDEQLEGPDHRGVHRHVQGDILL